MNSIIVIISCVIVVTLQQQQQHCPLGQSSFDKKKCIFAQSLWLMDSYFDDLSDCKWRAALVGFSNNQSSLVSILSAFENANVLGKW